ncbi:MAG: hypothetical protein R3F39_01510 [Myxococcota bacterium]
MSADSKTGQSDREPGFDVLDLTDVTPAEDIARAIAAAHQLESGQAKTGEMPPATAADLVARHRQNLGSSGWTSAPLVDPGDLWPAGSLAPPPPPGAADLPPPGPPPSPAAAATPAAEPERVRPATLDWVAERASSTGDALGGAASALASPLRQPGPPPAPAPEDPADDELPVLASPGSKPIVPELRGYDVSPAGDRHHSVEAELAKRLRKPTMQGHPTGVPFNDRSTVGVPGAEVTDALARSTRSGRLAQRGPHAPVEGLADDRGPLPNSRPPDVALEPRASPPAVPTARVRSSRLHHIRSAAAPDLKQRPEPHATYTRLATQGHEAVAAAGPWYRRMLLLVLLVLLDAALLPGARDGALVPPWLALSSPGSPTFIAATFLLIVSAVAFVPMPSRLRGALGTVLGLALCAFGLALFGGAVGADAFDGQPALAAVATASPAARWVLVLAVAILPAALFWRRHHPGGIGARILLGTGLLFVAFIYFAGHHIGLGDSMPLTAITRAGRTSPFLGDRVAAWLALIPFVLAPVALVSLSEMGRRGAAIVGALFWLGVAAPLVALAAFVAPASAFASTLFPLQVVAVLAAGLLLLPAGLGALFTSTLADDSEG